MYKSSFRLLFSRWSAFLHDMVWVPVALLLAYWIRFNLEPIPSAFWSGMYWLFAVVFPVQGFFFWFFGLYRGFWRFASVPDLVRIFKAVALGVLCSGLLVFILQRMQGIPRSVLLLYPLLLFLGLAGPRLIYRWLKDRHVVLEKSEGVRALIIGAGGAGEMLVRDLLKEHAYKPVGFLDDDIHKQGREIHGVRILGAIDDLSEVVSGTSADLVMLAMPSASHATLRHVVSVCQDLEIPCRTLPSVLELADGQVEVSRLRPIRIDDLLGRDVVALNDEAVHRLLEGRCVLVTGAGGSIGSELCRQIARCHPGRLLMLDHSEHNLYTIDQEMQPIHGDIAQPILADVRDTARMEWVFQHFRPEVVFHAAAYKHVPLVEENPAEGIKTNVLGTRTVADLAAASGVERFVLVSTDKAVNPANVMGASKRAAEIYCQNLDKRTSTRFITTRFGNVLGSAGSVVPLFQRQIEAGGPVTVTHPEITRYFMTIPEAVSLIMQAGAMGEGGEIFVLDMGEPIKIVDLAEQMIRLSGLEPKRDIEIVFTGLRPGEKLFEELFHTSEHLIGTRHPKILLAESREMEWKAMNRMLSHLQDACASRDVDVLLAQLHTLVPEFSRSQHPPVSEGTVLH
ncbi:MAG TPA: nucleoside-diphosphate sugar epimerase/dehydratase [Mariprofundaceae bacterium]|nr:nucleoside-diphosphate sugar epimerase/dehydratase [Mariprofundaceae bacterium]